MKKQLSDSAHKTQNRMDSMEFGPRTVDRVGFLMFRSGPSVIWWAELRCSPLSGELFWRTVFYNISLNEYSLKKDNIHEELAPCIIEYWWSIFLWDRQTHLYTCFICCRCLFNFLQFNYTRTRIYEKFSHPLIIDLTYCTVRACCWLS